MNFNFKLRKVMERHLVNSWNIQDVLKYKRDLQETYEPDYWQWLQRDQIVHSPPQKRTPSLQLFVDQEVVKTFSQDQSRIGFNKDNQGNMNKNAKCRRSGEWAQGNKLYLTCYQNETKKCRKLPLDYSDTNYGIDGDLDKIEVIFQSDVFPFDLGEEKGVVDSRYYIFALYDLQRVVFLQINDADLFFGEDKDINADNKSVAQSSVTASSFKSKFLTESMMTGYKKGKHKGRVPKTMKSRVVYFDELLEGKKRKGGESKTLREMSMQLIEDPHNEEWENTEADVDFENCIQKSKIVMPKMYLWNENAFKSFEIKFNVDPNSEIERSL